MRLRQPGKKGWLGWNLEAAEHGRKISLVYHNSVE
jgi:hypothetical protein